MLKITTQPILRRSLLSIGSCMVLLMLTTMLSQAQPGTIAPLPNPVERPKPNPPLPAYLETLRTTKYWENKFVGPDDQPSKVFAAFQQAYQAGEKIRSEIAQILQTGTPAGKMYAVVILADFDPEAAKQVLERMRHDDSVVLERTGELTTPQKVSTWAVSTLKGMEMQPYHAALPPHLATLREATRLEDRALGIAAVPSEIYQAFEQALQPGKTSRSDIDRLLHESTPAGRIYTAMLLVKRDPKAGRQLLEEMRSDQTALTEASGCEISQTTVGAAVADILQGRSGVFLPIPSISALPESP
jgi:hypothetical protein